MSSRESVFAYVRKKFGTEPEYPWARYPRYAVLRHRQGRKWYGLIMDVPANRLGPVSYTHLEDTGFTAAQA